MYKFSLLYDKEDYELLLTLNHLIKKNRNGKPQVLPPFQPNGIIEMSVPMEVRLALAVLRLLDTLEAGKTDERLEALRILHNEVMVASDSNFRINTGRILIHIMKELVRAYGDKEEQIKLIHEFRQAATGKPTVVRRLLNKYYLLEMPEAWNQTVIDNHVHDANTKGRKNATHLIMDAWIKGIRQLTVIYYNYVTPEAARELVLAAEIMHVSVRVALLFHASHRGSLVDLIWIPRGFLNHTELLDFLATPQVVNLMNEGRKATHWLEKRILHILSTWNITERKKLSELLAIEILPLDADKFLKFVGAGQASILHLAEFIHSHLLEKLTVNAREQKKILKGDFTKEEKEKATERLALLDSFTSEKIIERLNNPDLCPETSLLQSACDDADCPDFLKETPERISERLFNIRPTCRLVLNLARLSPSDVCLILWQCHGRISHLEIFNLKDWQNGELPYIKEISELQEAINENSVPRIKKTLFKLIEDEEAKEKESSPENSDSHRAVYNVGSEHGNAKVSRNPISQQLRNILPEIPKLCNLYKIKKLRSSIGTDSTSRAGHHYGMGLACPQTLPLRTQQAIRSANNKSAHLKLPLHLEVYEQQILKQRSAKEETSPIFTACLRKIGLEYLRQKCVKEWLIASDKTKVCGNCLEECENSPIEANIITLGGIGQNTTNGFIKEAVNGQTLQDKLLYLNTRFCNVVRFLIGFIPAFATFFATQTGFLCWFGAIIWFFISGMRNIVQSVLGNGGIHRSSLLPWKNFIRWSNVYTSLMYNGLSVVLLELVLRHWLLGVKWNVNSLSHPFLVYGVLALSCGLFKIFSHILRGFSLKSLVYDGVCTILSFPLALILHGVILCICHYYDASTEILPYLATFVIKLASDILIGFADGMTDRSRNLEIRLKDYKKRFASLFFLYSSMESSFPDKDVSKILEQPADLLREISNISIDYKKLLTIISLDMMYLWYYQPRANYALLGRLRFMSQDEKTVLLKLQEILLLEKEVSEMLVNGLAGKDFAGALSFYLEFNQEYLQTMKKVYLSNTNQSA